MLRITVLTERTRTVLKLDGKLTGPWVEELERCWQTVTSSKSESPVVVDLSDVSFVNPRGSALLERMHREGAELLGEGPMTGPLVEEITGHTLTTKGKVG